MSIYIYIAMKEKHFYLLTIDSRHQLYSYHIRIHIIIYRYISMDVLWQLLRVKVKPSRCVHNIIYVHNYVLHIYT